MKRLALAALLGAAALSPAPATAAIVFGSDPILFWNTVALANLPGSAPVQTRAYAMLNVAMHDAVNAALGKPNRGYLPGVAALGGDVRAAASQAAYNVLSALNTTPAAQAVFLQALNDSLSLSDAGTRAQGIATGAAYAGALLAARAADGSAFMPAYAPGSNPGDWRPTPPGNAAGALSNWGNVTPFLLTRGDELWPGPPPALTSAEYAAAYNEVKTVGAAGAEANGDRTPDQTASANFWQNANGSQWLRIGTQLAEDEGLTTLDNARMFALLTTALADTQIAGFDAKYLHEVDLWRPVTAIRLGDTDGNAATIGDPNWQPQNAAPAHPSYISTLSALSGAGSSILKSFLGDDEGFTLTINGLSRDFTGLDAAAADAANSRIWGGIHFRFDSSAGTQLGRNIAAVGLQNSAFQAVPEPSTWAMMIAGFGLIGGAVRRTALRGSALRRVVGICEA
jgi:hypothetical protein